MQIGKVRTILFFTALVLLVAISWHTIHFHHDHPTLIFGEKIQAITHAADKKVWLIVSTIATIISVAVPKDKLAHAALKHKTYEKLAGIIYSNTPEKILYKGLISAKIH